MSERKDLSKLYEYSGSMGGGVRGVMISALIWFIVCCLFGARVIGASITPWVGVLPFSLFFLICLGIWGVVNVVVLHLVWGRGFFKRGEALLEEIVKEKGVVK